MDERIQPGRRRKKMRRRSPGLSAELRRRGIDCVIAPRPTRRARFSLSANPPGATVMKRRVDDVKQIGFLAA